MEKNGRRLAVSVGIFFFALPVFTVGCGSSETQELRERNESLRAENRELEEEVSQLRSEVEELRDQSSEPAAQSEDTEQTEETPQEESAGEGSPLSVADPAEIGGEPVPEIMPEDFPLPEGATIEFTNEDAHTFSLEFVLDSDLGTLTEFYEEQLTAQGWEETDRTEYTREDLEGVDIFWEKGSYTPEGGSAEQRRQTLALTLQEIRPSGSAARVLWTDYQLLEESQQDQESPSS